MPQVPTVTPIGGSMSYQNASGASEAAFGGGANRAMINAGLQMEEAGNVLMRGSLMMQERENEAEDFETQRRYSEYNTGQLERMEEMKRGVSGDGNGFAKNMAKDYAANSRQWLEQNVPARLRPRYQAQLVRAEQQYKLAALDYQFKIQDEYYNTSLDKTLSDSLSLVDQDPAQLEGQKAKFDSWTDMSGLDEQTKLKRKRDGAERLESVAFKADNRLRGEDARKELGIGEASKMDAVASRVFKVESGNNPDAKNPNSSASGTAQMTDGTWLQMMRKYKPEVANGMSEAALLGLKRDDKLSREMGRHYLEEGADRLRQAAIPATPGNIYLSYFLGHDGAVSALSVDPSTPISKVIEPQAVAANKSILEGKTVGEVQAWADRKMGGERTEVASAGKYSNIPYEKKVALLKDAEVEAASIDAKRTAALKAENEERVNSFLVDVVQGTKGAADVQEAQKTWLRDYDDINKIYSAINSYQEKVGTAVEAQSKLIDPAHVWNPTDSDDKKRMNALFDYTEGPQKMVAMDNQYLENTAIPMIRTTGMIPNSLGGVFQQMLRTGDARQMDWALSAMDRVERENPQAFFNDLGEATTKQLTDWREKRQIMTAEDYATEVRKSRDPQQIKAKEELTQQGVELAGEISDSVLLDHFDPGLFQRGFDIPDGPADPKVNAQMRLEFNRLYAEQYAAGSLDPQKNALELLSKKWGASEIGGEYRIMKYPPQLFTKTVNGSYDWMDTQGRKDLAPFVKDLGDKPYYLVPDQQTEVEIANQLSPSYRVLVRNDAGQLLPVRDKEKGFVRLDFDVKSQTPELEKQFGGEPKSALEGKYFTTEKYNLPSMGLVTPRKTEVADAR